MFLGPTHCETQAKTARMTTCHPGVFTSKTLRNTSNTAWLNQNTPDQTCPAKNKHEGKTRPDQTRPNQTTPEQTKPDKVRARPNQTRPDQTRSAKNKHKGKLYHPQKICQFTGLFSKPDSGWVFFLIKKMSIPWLIFETQFFNRVSLF